jgi:hypothetical protein
MPGIIGRTGCSRSSAWIWLFLYILRELMTARRALMKDKVAAKARLQTTRQTLLRNQINARLKQIEIHIRQVDVAIAEKVALDKALSNKLAILISIPGIAKTGHLRERGLVAKVGPLHERGPAAEVGPLCELYPVEVGYLCENGPSEVGHFRELGPKEGCLRKRGPTKVGLTGKLGTAEVGPLRLRKLVLDEVGEHRKNKKREVISFWAFAVLIQRITKEFQVFF